MKADRYIPHPSPDIPARYPRFYECGICGHYHAEVWDGDCRDDSARFTCEELDCVYGTLGWTEVPMPGDDNPFPLMTPEAK